MEHILIILGEERSHAKMIPLYFELRRHGLAADLAITQQKDPLVEELLSFFELEPCAVISSPTNKNNRFDETTLKDINDLFDKTAPSLVLVEGENDTATATAIAAYFRKIPVGHIDAGIKRPTRGYPRTQKLLNLLSSFHFTSTPSAAAQILAQGIQGDSVFSIGNLTGDLIKAIQEKILNQALSISIDAHEAISFACAQGYRRLLVSFNQDQYPESERNSIFESLKCLLAMNPELCIFFACEQGYLVDSAQHMPLYTHERFFICPLTNFIDEVYALQSCDIVLTDSVHLHENALCLSKPILFMKSTIDNREGVWAGLTHLTSADRQKMSDALLKLEKKQRSDDNLHCRENKAASKIAEIVSRITRQMPNKQIEKEYPL